MLGLEAMQLRFALVAWRLQASAASAKRSCIASGPNISPTEAFEEDCLLVTSKQSFASLLCQSGALLCLDITRNS